jgi:hypothetical protein
MVSVAVACTLVRNTVVTLIAVALETGILRNSNFTLNSIGVSIVCASSGLEFYDAAPLGIRTFAFYLFLFLSFEDHLLFQN